MKVTLDWLTARKASILSRIDEAFACSDTELLATCRELLGVNVDPATSRVAMLRRVVRWTVEKELQVGISR